MIVVLGLGIVMLVCVVVLVALLLCNNSSGDEDDCRLAYNTDSVFFCSILSSPRAKRAGLKGLRAESARAVTGRRCPHSGRGEDFLTGQLNFFTETAVTPERKVEKSFPRWEINRHAEG